MENWKAIAGYESRYEVSTGGKVRCLNFNHTGKPRILKLRKRRDGYLLVDLCKDGNRKSTYVHRLVAEAFIPNPQNLDTVNHRDEDKTNNNVSNLEWMTLLDNNRYGTHDKRVAEARSKQVKQLDKRGNLLATYPSMREAERRTGIAASHIAKCCLGRRKSAGGYVWKYA